MVGIGFKNFRKFSEFDNLSIKPLTFLVGANGSGKSTVIKALLLAIENIRGLVTGKADFDQSRQPIFEFSFSKGEDMLVDMLCNRQNNVDDIIKQPTDAYRNENTIHPIEICYTLQIDDCVYSIDVLQNAKQPYSKIEDINFDYATIRSLYIRNGGDVFSIDFLWDWYVCIEHEGQKRILGECAGAGPGIFDCLLFEDVPQSFINNISSSFRNIDCEYIRVHSVKQKYIYSADDKNDYLSQSINEFFNSRVLCFQELEQFLSKWLNEFSIGSSIKIVPIIGRNYEVNIADSNGIMPLAVKSIGQIQIVLLLMRICIMAKRSMYFKDWIHHKQKNALLILEEPEQNLHPAFQSKLFDLFEYSYKTFGINFIIETHSEYLIRRSQVLVSKLEKDEENPVKIMYFPTDDKPYEMKFRSDGLFENDFGPGFLDETGNIIIELFKR